MNQKNCQTPFARRRGAHDSECAKSLGVTGRYSDRALNWFCHHKLHELIDGSDTIDQKTIAEASGVPAGAINTAYNGATGIGFGQLEPLAKYFKYKSRAEFLAAVDSWWNSEGKDYALKHTALTSELRAAIISEISPGLAGSADPVIRRKRALLSKAQKRLNGPDDAGGRGRRGAHKQGR